MQESGGCGVVTACLQVYRRGTGDKAVAMPQVGTRAAHARGSLMTPSRRSQGSAAPPFQVFSKAGVFL